MTTTEPEPVPDPLTQAVTAAACELVRVLVGEAFGPARPDPRGTDDH